VSAQPVAVRKNRIQAVVLGDQGRIPAWVIDHDSYRRWACSGDYPESGWISYINGEIWVDLSMEALFSHNRVKSQIGFTLMTLLNAQPIGTYFPDRLLFTNQNAGITTEPDGLFCYWETVQSGRARYSQKTKDGDDYLELVGTPDMVLEVVSRTSVRKDTKELLRDYWQAGIAEYWLVDARKEPARFDIFQHAARGYRKAKTKEGWAPSKVFGKSFQLRRGSDPLGDPQFALLMK
jgi:Uma2 family endonuclease